MARLQSFKIGVITPISPMYPGLAFGDGSMFLVPENLRILPVLVGPAWVAAQKPKVGGWYLADRFKPHFVKDLT